LFLAAYRSLTIADQYFLVEAAGIENVSTVVNTCSTDRTAPK